jgi:Zn-dependent peptidase ImmA (M78 family)
VESVAESLRREWELGEGPIENLSEVLEEHGLKVGLVGGHAAFDALTLWFDHEAPVIAIKRDLPGDRHRFNLAHELGHIVLKAELLGLPLPDFYCLAKGQGPMAMIGRTAEGSCSI